MDDERKLLTVTGDSVSPEHVGSLLERAGYRILGEVPMEFRASDPVAHEAASPQNSWLKTYYPLLLILSYLLGGVVLLELRAGHWDWMRVMAEFMGGFFLIFSFFKLLNLRGFADAYQTYDILARRSRTYALTYPFLELALGVGYLSEVAPRWVNAATLVVMGVSSIGVLQALMKRSRIQCACLGTVFQLPMTQVTLFEDLLMVLMAAASLASMSS
jgi:hypothetical protein